LRLRTGLDILEKKEKEGKERRRKKSVVVFKARIISLFPL